MQSSLIGEHADGFAISMQRAYVDVYVPPLDAVGAAAVGEIGIHQGSEVLIRSFAVQPQTMRVAHALPRTPAGPTG